MAYTLKNINDSSDFTFNQILAINDEGEMAGYFGSGLTTAHPNRGYVVQLNSAGTPIFTPEDYPLSVQTQVTGINNGADTVGFEVDAAGNSYGFVDIGGNFSIAVDPAAPTLSGIVSEQFLGINDMNEVAGFYVKDAAGDAAGFVYNANTGAFTAVTVSGATSVTASDVNAAGEISGFFTAGGKTEGFYDTRGVIHDVPGRAGWTNVQVLGLNSNSQLVGSYLDTGGNTDGFVYDVATGVYTTIRIGPSKQTVVNGINNQGDLVGFFMDQRGNTDGMLLIPPTASTTYKATTIDDPADPTFNQLLSINNSGEIVGYFGSGLTASHPNQGYLFMGGSTFLNENYPGSTQTQVTGINNDGQFVGFEIDAAGNSVGFFHQAAAWTLALDPSAPRIGGVVNEQFLGINDHHQVAGFYTTDSKGDTAGFVYNDVTGTFTNVSLAQTGKPTVTSVSATDINDQGYISGFYTIGGKSEGFIDENGKIVSITGGAGDTNVQVLGLNNTGEAVGSFQSGNLTEGFIYSLVNGSFTAYNAPGAVGQTVLNGINDLGQIAGFNMDAAGNTHGLVLKPV